MSFSETSRAIRHNAGVMLDDIASEVKHEMHNIRYIKEPVDPTQNDHVVRHHVAGLSISFFAMIVFFLTAVIAAVAIYQRAH